MKCPICKVEIDNTVLDSGRNSYCANCLSPLLQTLTIKNLSSILNINFESDMLYAKSEMCYNQEIGDMDEAFNYCYQAAQKGHPAAIINLGYYLETGNIKGEASELLAKALECYLAVGCYDGYVATYLDSMFIHYVHNVNLNMEEHKDLIGEALYNSLCILINNDFTSIEVGGVLIKNQKDFILMLKNLCENNYGYEELKNLTADEMDYMLNNNRKIFVSDTNSLKEFFIKMDNKLNEPIYAIHRINPQELKEVFEECYKARPKVFDHFVIFLRTSNDNIRIANATDFSKKIDSLISQYKEVYICIYKKKNLRHQFNYCEKGHVKRETFIFDSDKFTKYVSAVDFKKEIGNVSTLDIEILFANADRNINYRQRKNKLTFLE